MSEEIKVKLPTVVEFSGNSIKFHNSRQIFEENVNSIWPVSIGNETIRIAKWGKDNLFPNALRENLNKSAVGLDCLQFKQQITYGSGLKYGYIGEEGEFIDQTNKGFFKEVDTFFQQNGMLNNYLEETINNLHTWGFATPNLLLNKDRDPQQRKVIQLTAMDTFFCRFKEVEKLGYISHAVYTDWYNYRGLNQTSGKEEQTSGLGIGLPPVIIRELLRPNNPLSHLEQLAGRKKSLQNYPSGAKMKAVRSKENEFGMLLRSASTGNTYYPYQPHYSVFQNGWVDISNDIPLYKHRKMKNTLQVAYKVSFTDRYWQKLFAKNGLKTEEQQQAFALKQLENIKKFLHGVENAGKTLIEENIEITEEGKPVNNLIIEKIERDVEKGEYLEDSHEASSMLYTAFGVNPNLRSGIPGKSSGGFNGTDKRELLRIAQTLEQPLRDKILEPLYLIKQFNRWDERVVFSISDIILTTLDQGKEVQEITRT